MIAQNHTRFLLAAIVIPLLLMIVAILMWLGFLHTTLISDEHGFKFKVHTGATYRTIASELHDQHILKHPYMFTVLFRLKGNMHELKAGEYLFPKGTTPSSLIDQVVTGRGMINHAFLIIPGYTFHQLRQILDNDENVIHTTKNLSDSAIMSLLGHPSQDPEGLFYPDTYYFMADTADIALLKRSFLTMQKKINTAWQRRTPNLPFHNPYEALIAASIIEKETAINTERPIIAGVLVNRLNKGILLQFDPTVIYGIGARYDGTIYKRDLTDPNPYNTYVHKGLPPTPISMPSIASIEAVMRPDVNDYLYFVARGNGNGHQFSKTLTEHYVAVAEAKKHKPGYFNDGLIKTYLMKSLTKNSYMIFLKNAD